MKKDDEKLQSLRGKAMRAFRKIALPVVASVALMGGMAQEANAQTTYPGQTYSQSVTQTDPSRPWLQDQRYQEQMDNARETLRLRVEAHEAQARAQKARQEADIMVYRNNHLKRLAQLRSSGRAKWSDYAALSQSMTAYEAQHRSHMVNIETRLQQTIMVEEQKLVDYEARLDNQYAHMSPYKEMLAEQRKRQAERVTNAQQRADAQAQSNANRPLTQAEQDARLRQAEQERIARQLRAFQDAQFEAVKNGTEMPKREDFGLPPERTAGNNAPRVNR